MLKTTFLVAIIAAAATVAAPARAQAVCGDRTEIIERLSNGHAESPQAIGLSADGAVFEVLASPGGSWTILITYPGRPTCVGAAGEGWESLPITPAGQPS